MASIGLIVKADAQLEQLPSNWVPERLGTRREVMAVIARCVPIDESMALSLRLEEPESLDPRCITATGVWGPKESAALMCLCQALGARFYDAEAAEFVEL